MHDAHIKPRPLGGPILTVPVAILSVLTLVGFYYIAKRYFFGIAAIALNPGYPWGIWVAFDVIVGPAIGCGGFAMALLTYVLNQGKYHPIMRPALLGGLFGYTLAGVAVLIDLGRYFNSLNLLLPWYLNTNSIMLETALCVMAYVSVLWIEFSPAFLERFGLGRMRLFLERYMFVIIALGVLLPTMHQSALAWVFTQRICGVCTTVHAITSVRAVENALQLKVPLNAQYIRNLIIAAHGVHDHIVHFYHLAALDWVDIVSALSGDPAGAAKISASLSEYKGNSEPQIRAVRDKLAKFVGSGQLGVYASGYWGHPAMKLPPDINLLAATHYVQALEVQRIANKIVSVLGSKTPHIQNLAVGGVANPINPESQSTLTLERLYAIKTWIDELDDFVNNAMIPDVTAVGAVYADWTKVGAGVTNYLSVPDLPIDTRGTKFAMPGGYIKAADLASFKTVDRFGDPYFRDNVQESVKHAWYDYSGDGKALHPFKGETAPRYTDWRDDGKYSWIKAPTFQGERAQVGPLANVLAMVVAGHEPTKKHLTRTLKIASTVAGTEIPVAAVHSTIGRIAARAVRCAVLLDELKTQWQLLIDNIAEGDMATFNRPVFPKGEVAGVGFHEAPRGVLSHWIVIEDGKIKNYQAVVPSTWNAGPRDDNDRPGPYEASLVDNPVADPEKPLEVLRTVHSFDPCIACAIHLADTERRPIVSVKAF